MKYNIPQIKQISETSCASATYTMVANALGFDYPLEYILKITKSEIGFAFFWRFLIENKNIEIVDFSKNNLKIWAEKGFIHFQQETKKEPFNFFNNRMTDLNKYQEDLKYLFKNKNFKFFHKKPNTNLLKKYFSERYVCDVMLDPWLIYGEKPPYYSLHRVFIVDINNDEIIFHNPSSDGEAFYKSNTSNFKKAFQIDGAELTCYKIKTNNINI
ncbi:MAG: hypothetical protein Q7T79_00935 [bacterium]|nr:hypothetical protein [bacterium]